MNVFLSLCSRGFFPRFHIFYSASISHASRNTLFLIIAIKTSRLFGGNFAHPVPFTLFFYLRLCFPIPFPSPSSPLVLVSLLNYSSARSCRAKLGCGRRSRDTTPHHSTPEAVKNSSACQAWNFDIERKAGRHGATPRWSRQEAGRWGVRDCRDIY